MNSGNFTEKDVLKANNFTFNVENSQQYLLKPLGSQQAEANSASELLIPWYKRKRYLPPLACFLAVFMMYITRFALSQAIIYVSKYYNWTESQSAMAAYSFYVGYLMTQILGGYCSHLYGSKPVVSIGIGVSCLATCLFPLLAFNFPMVIVLRMLTGIGQGVLYPAMVELLSHWILPSEKSLVFNFAWSGGQAGTIFALGSYPYIAAWTDWKWPFYIYALIGVAWFLLWQFFIYETPDKHPGLNPREKALLDRHQDRGRSNSGSGPEVSRKVPWLALLSSPSLYVLMSIYFTYCWTFYLLISYLPLYLTYVLGYEGASQGLLAMSPYIGLWICLIVSGLFSDYLIRTGMPTIVVRKLMVIIGLFFPACLMIILSYYQDPSSHFFILVSLFCIISISGFSMAGYSPNPMELSPTYSGIITSLGNIVGGSAGIFSLLFTGFMLKWGQCEKSFPPSDQNWSCLLHHWNDHLGLLLERLAFETLQRTNTRYCYLMCQ